MTDEPYPESPMGQRDQIHAFDGELCSLINRFRQEFDLSFAEIIGVLEVRKSELVGEVLLIEEMAGIEDDVDPDDLEGV